MTHSKYLYWGLFALISWMSALPSWAQQTGVSLSGTVVDQEQHAVSLAQVRLLNTAGKLHKGTTTNSQGQFALERIPNGSYTLVVSMIGYVEHRQSLKIDGQSLRLPTIKIGEDSKVLSEVVVRAKANEVVIKGDTLEYNASSYTTVQGAVLKDLIKQLPGAEVNEQGQITINGKVIKQIMVDGKRFFESDPKVAINNLPAELIEKVQVLDRETESARMTGFSDGDEETIINLTVKAGRKRGLFGTAFAGYGTQKRYEGNAIVNRFSDDNQWTVLAGLNNTNNAGSTDIASDANQGALLSMSGGGRRGNPGARNTGKDGLSTSKLLGVNTHFTFSPSFKLGGNGFYGNNDKSQSTKSSVQNILSTGGTTEQSQTSDNNNRHNVGANLRMEWQIDKQTELVLQPQISYGWVNGFYQSEATMSSTNNLANELNRSKTTQDTYGRVYTTELRGDFSRRLGSMGRTISLSFNGKFGQNTGEGSYKSLFVSNVNPSDNRDVNQQLQNSSRETELRAKLTYVEPLSKNLFAQIYYQIKGETSTSDRQAFDYDPLTQSFSLANALYSNDFESTFIAHTIGAAIKHKSKTHDLTLGFNVNPSTLNSRTMAGGHTYDPIQRTVVNFSPSVRFNYKPRKGTDLRIDYSGRSFQPTTNQLSPVEDVTNPLVQYVGNQSLKPGFKHNLFGRFSTLMAESQSSLNLFTHMSYTQNDIVTRTTYDPSGKRTVTYTNVNGNAMIGLGGFYNRPILGKRLSLRLSTFNNLSNHIGFVNNERNSALSLNIKESLGLNYRNDWVDTSLKGGWGYNKVTNSLSNVKTTSTNNYEGQWLTTLSLPLGFTIESDLNYEATRGYGQGFDQDQWVLNAGISYSFLPNRAATLRLKIYDALGSQLNNNIYRSVTATSISSHETNRLGQYAMLHFIYRFNSFSGNASASDMKQMGPGGGPGRGPGGGPGGPPPGPPPF